MKNIYIDHEQPFIFELITQALSTRMPACTIRPLQRLKSQDPGVMEGDSSFVLVFIENISNAKVKEITLLRARFLNLVFVFISTQDESIVRVLFSLGAKDVILSNKWSLFTLWQNFEECGVLDKPAIDNKDPKTLLLTLTKRQKQFLILLANGKTNSEIAEILQLSQSTVKVHLCRMYQRLNVHNRVQAINIGRNWGYC